MTRTYQNPYTQRTAIRSESEFFGRKNELRDLYTRLLGGQSVALVGERRIGKSSILKALQFRSFRDSFTGPEDLCLVFVDAQEVAGCTEEEFFEVVMTCFREASGVRLEGRNYQSLGLACRRLERENKRPVLLIDEFDALTSNPRLDPSFFGRLRALVNRCNLCYVVAFRRSNPPEDSAALYDAVGSSFLNVFGWCYLGPFLREEAVQLIMEPASRQQVEFTQDDVKRVIEIAGYYPMFIQIACYHLFEEVISRSKRTDSNWEHIGEAYVYEATAHLWYMAERLSEGERRAVLAFRQQPDSVSGKDVEWLVKKGVLIRDQGTLRLFFDKFVTFVETITRDKAIVHMQRDKLSELGRNDAQPQELHDVVDDQNVIVDILATLSATSLDPREFFRDLMNQSALPRRWKETMQGVWSGDTIRDAKRLVDWANGRGVNPGDPRYTALGSILSSLLRSEIGLDQSRRIVELIFKYHLCLSQAEIVLMSAAYGIPTLGDST